jgi:hypothetical protein
VATSRSRSHTIRTAKKMSRRETGVVEFKLSQDSNRGLAHILTSATYCGFA